jgi:hypothetical protein
MLQNPAALSNGCIEDSLLAHIPRLVDGIAASLKTGRHRAIVRSSHVVIRGLSGGLLARLLSSFVAATESASEATHGGAGCGAFTRVASYSAANRAERCATTRAFDNVTLRRLVRLGLVRTRSRSRRFTRIESGLFDCPRMAFIAIFVLLSLTLSL